MEIGHDAMNIHELISLDDAITIEHVAIQWVMLVETLLVVLNFLGLNKKKNMDKSKKAPLWEGPNVQFKGIIRPVQGTGLGTYSHGQKE